VKLRSVSSGKPAVRLDQGFRHLGQWRSHRSLAFASAIVCHCRVGRGVETAAGQRNDVVANITGTGATGLPGRRTRVLPLKFGSRPMRAMLSRIELGDEIDRQTREQEDAKKCSHSGGPGGPDGVQPGA
jgi:hypothetical protein